MIWGIFQNICFKGGWIKPQFMVMKLITEPYKTQSLVWPVSGRHILAQFDDETIVVYQAFRPSAGRYAAENGFFAKDFSYSRMSWIKPNFLWMMYRSGWGTKDAQETTLAIRLRRNFFDGLLAQAVASIWEPSEFETEDEWSLALKSSCVRVQWDPDHDPHGAKVARRAIQLGLKGHALKCYGQKEPLQITDISDFVSDQRQRLKHCGISALETPQERVYIPSDPKIAKRLQIS
jgi:hypothetical protein